MSEKIYWNLLVLFAVLCQGIICTLLENDMDKSSELLDRQKRVINSWPGADKKAAIRDSPYIVAIKPFRVQELCAGVIITEHIVLTAAKCVISRALTYRVYSGTSLVSPQGHSVVHNMTEKKELVGHHPYRPNDGLALLTVTPPFIYSINTRNIELYEGPVHPGLHGTVCGWGCNPMGHPGTDHPDRLRSITVPLISNHDCAMLYHRNFAIADSDICTLEAAGRQYCGVDDAGAPLVFKVNEVDKLVGIHLWNGGIIGQSNPDVFVNLQHPDYKTWIKQTIRSFEVGLNIPIHSQHSPHSPENQPNLRSPSHQPNLRSPPHHPNLHSPPYESFLPSSPHESYLHSPPYESYLHSPPYEPYPYSPNLHSPSHQPRSP